MGKDSRRRNRISRDKHIDVPVVANPEPAQLHPSITGGIGIQAPPDEIFKYRRNRGAPAQEVWSAGTVSYAPYKAEYIEGKGSFVYYYGVDLPSRCVAPVEAIHAINPIKRGLINSMRLLAAKELRIPLISLVFIGEKNREKLLNLICEYFNNDADITAGPYYLKDGFYSEPIREIQAFIYRILIGLGVQPDNAHKTGEIIGMLFEYDNAYRWRVQDLFTETTKEALMNDFPKEIERLLTLSMSRDPRPDLMEFKFKGAVKKLKYLWWIPSFREIIRNAIAAMDLEKCKLDESDVYHSLLYASYNVGGKTLEERVQIYKGIYGEDMKNWPPRISIGNSGNRMG